MSQTFSPVPPNNMDDFFEYNDGKPSEPKQSSGALTLNVADFQVESDSSEVPKNTLTLPSEVFSEAKNSGQAIKKE